MIAIPTIAIRNTNLQNSSRANNKNSKVHPNNVTDSDTNVSNKSPTGQFNQRNKSFAAMKFIPKLGHALNDWIDLPTDYDQSSSIIFNSITLPFKWLLWTTKALAGLPPHQSLRERLCNQAASLGNVAGLFLVIAISAFFMPPAATSDLDKTLVNVYGVLMFFSAMTLTVYVCLSLTVMYPLLESIPDFAAMEAYQNLAERWGGYELFLFNIGCQSVMLAMIITAKVVYGWPVLYAILGIFALLYCFAAFMTREFFIAIDPITTVHMGICNAPQTIARAKALVAALKSRHLEFMEDSDNEEEYVATHYMDPQARLNVTQQRAAKRLASLPAVHSNSNSNKQLGTAGPAVNQDRAVNNLQSSSRSTAGAAASSAAGVRVHCDRDCEQVTTIGAYSQRQPQQHQSAISHEVTDFQLSDFEPATMPAADHKTATVPSLEAILLGEKCLLRAKGSNLSVVDCEQVYNILRRQGCRSTEHLVSLLQWQCADATQSGTDTRRNETDNMTSSIASLDKGRCFKVCVDLGIPAFHVMDLVVYLQEQLH